MFCVLTGPFNSSLGCDSALKEIARFRTQLKALRQEEGSVLQGLGFFEIEQPPFRALKMMEKVCLCSLSLHSAMSSIFAQKNCSILVLCAGHGQPAEGLGGHSGLEQELERLEGWPVHNTANREHGERHAGAVQETAEVTARAEGVSSCLTHTQCHVVLLP